jgi:hypothetical protein
VAARAITRAVPAAAAAGTSYSAIQRNRPARAVPNGHTASSSHRGDRVVPSTCPAGQLSAGGNGAVNEPDVRACLVGSWDRVGELGHGQVTVQGLKAVMIHGRN